MRLVFLAGLVAAGLAGCQSVQDSAAEADIVCQNAGHRVGSRAFEQCRREVFQSFRRSNAVATSAVAGGLVAGAVGGAIVAGSRSRYYGYGYCDAYGCW